MRLPLPQPAIRTSVAQRICDDATVDTHRYIACKRLQRGTFDEGTISNNGTIDHGMKLII